MKKRASGILMHISSLPSPYGIGDLGEGAYHFADFLSQSGQQYWQILPLTPTDMAQVNSPYSSCSALAGNTLFISPDLLKDGGLLTDEDLAPVPSFPLERVDYYGVTEYKRKILLKAYERYEKTVTRKGAFEKFCVDNASWLNDYALFLVLKEKFDKVAWVKWPKDIRGRKKEAIRQSEKELAEPIRREKFYQYLFFEQWAALKTYCNKKDIAIIGDLPIYVQHDSVDVWTSPESFKLDEEGEPQFMAGVPPDYFSATGQLWGNPVYCWETMQANRYAWWKKRLRHSFACFDIVRVDHFRGFVDYWQVPKGETTAVNGEWVEAPAEDFLDELLKTFKDFPIIAEDLGILSDNVKEIIKAYKFPGMKILLFAFDSDDANPYLPPNHVVNCIVYTGTHDNNTTLGWFRHEATDTMKARMAQYLGEEPRESDVHWQLISMAMASKANTVIIPLQDILGLDERSRMNMPGTIEHNWSWRVLPQQMASVPSEELLRLTLASKRS